MKLKKILLFEKYSNNKSFRKTIKIEDFQILFNTNNISNLNNTTFNNLNKLKQNIKKKKENNNNLISLKKSLKPKNLKENNININLKNNTSNNQNEINNSKETNCDLTNINYIPTSTTLTDEKNKNLNEKDKNKIIFKSKKIKKFKMTYNNKEDEEKIKNFYIETLRNNKNTTPSKFVLKPERIGKRKFKNIVPSKKNINLEIIPKEEDINKVKRKKLIFYKIFKK